MTVSVSNRAGRKERRMAWNPTVCRLSCESSNPERSRMTIKAIIRKSEPTASREGSSRFKTAGPKSTPTKSMPMSEGIRALARIQSKTRHNKTTAARLNAIQTSTENGCITGVISSLQSPAVFVTKANPIAVPNSRKLFPDSQGGCTRVSIYG